MESETTRELSSSLFQVVKPFCLLLSEISVQNPINDPETLTHCLKQISINLAAHFNQVQKKNPNSLDQYVISTRLADYIFFPLSNLLKQPSLSESVTRYILEILAFLVTHSWSHDIDEQLLDQLFTLVVFLTRGGSQTRAGLNLSHTESTFLTAAASCIISLNECVPRDYYTSGQNLKKRLSILGDATTTLLDLLELLGSTEEDVRLILKNLAWLYSTRVTPEQASFVFPGIVSKVINFHTKTKNMSSESLIATLHILQVLVVRVFSDKELGIIVSDPAPVSDLSILSSLLDMEEKERKKASCLKVTFDNPERQGRTEAWLAATSKQLKLSLLIFMKNVILNASSRTKVVANLKLVDKILEFVSEISTHCFKALFNEVIPSTLDIVAALYYVQTFEQADSTKVAFMNKIDKLYLMVSFSDLRLWYNQVYLKTEDLILSQLSRILISSSEEKICLCLAAVEVHLRVVSSLADTLGSSHERLDHLHELTLETLAVGIQSNLCKASTSKLGTGKKQLLDIMSGVSHDADTSSNTLDNIELPPHINAKNLAMVREKKSTRDRNTNTNTITNTARAIDLDFNSIDSVRHFFASTYSRASERAILSLVSFLGDHCNGNNESIVSSLIINTQTVSLTQRTVSLWLCNAFHKATPKYLNVDDFLDFGDGSDHEDSHEEETNYLLLQTAQDLLDDTKSMLDSLSTTQLAETKSCEDAYTVALQTIEILAGRLSKTDFQTDVLMDYLYPILEALTYTAESQVQLQARLCLRQIIDQHYHGSVQSLIEENADYLIDSLSMNLSVASGLKPSLPGILLLVIRISGAELLLSNQLQDILSEMFIVIDSFHGYSVLVENFFLVFEEIVAKIKDLYGKQLSDNAKLGSAYVSSYKPWGLSNRQEMLRLIDDANKLVDSFADYDSNKEYFQRKPDMPFGDQDEDQAGDSDDEDDSDVPQDVPEVWPSPVPKNVFGSVQQLFTYGLQLLSNPSVKLKIQILRTLKEAYPIMASNYKLLMPILAQYWPLLLVMSTGQATLTENVSESSLNQNDQLITPTVELMITIFYEDRKHEHFMASRFIDMWDFMKRKVSDIASILETPLVDSSALTKRHPSQKKLALYSSMLLKGMGIYHKALPDLSAHEIARVCYVLGIDPSEKLGTTVRSHLWVLKYMAHENSSALSPAV